MHVNTYLYKHVHSHHHRLTVPYAYGALYNHPLEALLLDTLGGVITLYASGMRSVHFRTVIAGHCLSDLICLMPSCPTHLFPARFTSVRTQLRGGEMVHEFRVDQDSL